MVTIVARSKTLRGEIINKIIFGEKFRSNVTAVNKVVQQHVEIYPEGKFKCRLCKRIFGSYESIFKHIAVRHRELVDDYYEDVMRVARWWE